MNQPRRRTLLALTLALLSLAACDRNGGGVEVEVENASPAALQAVWLFARGDSVAVGDLAAGEVRRVMVRPRAESGLEVAHGGMAGRRLVLDTYFEPGYVGPIELRVSGDSAWVTAHAALPE